MWGGEAVQGWGEGKEAGEGRRGRQGVEADKSPESQPHCRLDV